MSIADNPCFAEINSCSYLFVDALNELPGNGLQVVLREGLVRAEATTLKIADTQLTGLHAIEATEKSRSFEVKWEYYVAYSVVNESFKKRRTDELWAGDLFRIYTKSCFIDFVAAATFATDEYPGPLQHIGLLCEDHIVDVISTKEPSVKKLS